tara:strand:+ start:1772 stop:1894 length:123 start_codon:yes stop_codon:yes gene_type:complete
MQDKDPKEFERNGKGSLYRIAFNDKKYKKNYDKIFRKKNK